MSAPTLPAPADHQGASDDRSATDLVRDDAIWEQMAAPVREEEAAVEAAEAEAEGRARDERGRFTKAAGVKESTPSTDEAKGQVTDLTLEEQAYEKEQAEATAQDEAEAESAPEPEVEAAEEAPPEPRKLATQFTAKDREGEVEIPDDLVIEFKAHGEVRQMPLDKVVRLAQSGFYNEQLQTEVKSSRAEVAEIRNEYAGLKDALERQLAFNRALLENGDEFFLQQREEYQRRNSPEERARRLEQELIRERSQREQILWQQQATSFLQTNLEPKVSTLLAEYPTVTDVEAAGWLAPHLKALEVNGVIPPARYGEVARVLEEDLAPWMAQMHLMRQDQAKQTEATRTVQLRRAQAEAAKAKRTLTKVASPAKAPGAVTGRPGTSKATPDKLSAAEANEAFWHSLSPTQEE